MALCEAEKNRCRLCWGDEDDSPLVQPCACRGSAKFIHKHCLEKWRRTSPREDTAYRCGQCRDHYRGALSLELLGARLQAERTDGEATISTLDTLARELQTQGKYDEADTLLHLAVSYLLPRHQLFLVPRDVWLDRRSLSPVVYTVCAHRH